MIPSQVAELAGATKWAVLDACNKGEFPRALPPGQRDPLQTAWVIPWDEAEAWAARYGRYKPRKPLQHCTVETVRDMICDAILNEDGKCPQADNHTL